MKRKLTLAAGFMLMMLSFTSCEDLLTNCKICQQNTYNASSGVLLTEGTETKYCDTDLIVVENIKDETVLGVTTKWECR